MSLNELSKIIFLLIAILILRKDLNAQNQIKYSIKNPLAITAGDHYSSPVWSPDGEKIFFTKINFNGLYFLTIKNKEIKELVIAEGVGYNAAWSADSKLIYYRIRIINANNSSTFKVKSINIDTKEILDHPNIHPDGIGSSVSFRSDKDPIVYTNTKTLLIEAQSIDKSEKWVITKDSGQYYQPLLSPDKTKIIVHKGADMLIYSVKEMRLLKALGKGLACSWTSDSKQIIYFIDESEDGHQITGSEIYICNIEDSKNWQLTNTPDVYEMFPTFSPDNKKIAYADGKTGKIFIADLLKQ